MVEGSASTTISQPPAVVFAAVADVTRMGEWSPECVAGRWVPPASGPALGAKFEGDNVAKMGPVTLKKWTTVSEITEFTEDEVFEFVTEDYTIWRYEFEDRDGSTQVTESFSYRPYEGRNKFFYETLGKRSAGMPGAVAKTLAQIKSTLEAS